MKKQNIDPNVIIKYGVTLAGLYIVYKLAQKVGIFPSQESKAEAQNLQQLEAASVWDYNKFLSSVPPGALLLTQAGAAAYVEDLWDATGYINDDEETIYGVFRAMKTQSQIAALAKRFNQLKNRDLYGYLRNYLNDAEMLNIKKIIDQKPKYFI
jgi:hypothetical protein